MALTDKLNAIGDAIRAKTGGTEKLTLDQMPTEIASITTGGGDFPEEAFVLTGNQSYRFAGTSWNWFIEEYGDRITTRALTYAPYMFRGNNLESIPFEINFSGGSLGDLFSNSNIRTAPKITGSFGRANGESVDPNDAFPYCSEVFRNCFYLREIAEPDLIKNYYYSDYMSMFENCYSLREIPAGFIKLMDGGISYAFMNCHSLNKIINLPVSISKGPYSQFQFTDCYRLARLTFETNEDGSPKVVDYWKEGEYIDLSEYVGYAKTTSGILNYNSGITANKEVTNLTSYNALKNDPDWFTTNIAYSRYNKMSAVETINSLPDASTSEDTSHIIFKGASGSLTDGGAIDTMTEEQIAVATAKGWTVSFK